MPLLDRPVSPDCPEAVIREARRRRHRRWAIAGTVAIVLGSAITVVLVHASSTSGRRLAPAAPPSRDTKPPPIGRVAGAQPTQPGPLAVTPGGTLLVADEAQNRILARSPSGRFRVIAGNGKYGFSGDGGPAVDAELAGPQGIAVAADGTVYFVDRFNNRIRCDLTSRNNHDGRRKRATSPSFSFTGIWNTCGRLRQSVSQRQLPSAQTDRSTSPNRRMWLKSSLTETWRSYRMGQPSIQSIRESCSTSSATQRRSPSTTLVICTSAARAHGCCFCRRPMAHYDSSVNFGLTTRGRHWRHRQPGEFSPLTVPVSLPMELQNSRQSTISSATACPTGRTSGPGNCRRCRWNPLPWTRRGLRHRKWSHCQRITEGNPVGTVAI